MTASAEPVRLPRRAEKRRRISFAAILALSFSALIILAVGGVLAVSVGANYRNTVDLLGARSGLLIDAIEDALESHMRNAESAVDGVARIYAEGGFEIDDSSRMRSVLSGALAAAPESRGLIIFTSDFYERGVVREPDDKGAFLPISRQPVSAADSISVMKHRLGTDGRAWGPIVTNEFGTFANVSTPLVRNGVSAGFVVAPVELRSISAFTQKLSERFGTTAFILDSGEKVLAHRLFNEPNVVANRLVPPVPLAAFGDPVIQHFAERKPQEYFDESPVANVEVSEIQLDRDVGPRGYVAMTRQIRGFSDRPWTIGVYFEGREIAQELSRAAYSALIGLGALLAALIAAILLGKRLSRPVQAIAGHAIRVADFDVDDLPPLPRSRVRELDDQTSAFNAMLVGLRAFSTYIPRSLVAKLVRSGEAGIAEPREALVTVMFTDIVAFTTISERMDAAETTRLLNEHFQILCEAVDQHGGTVDKFLGDGMMAFFGAPDHLEHHAEAAVLAAAQMRADIEAKVHEARIKNGTAFRMRIGIHTGPVTVGNIGGSDRVNYTIIGDTVNVSQRLQGLAKSLEPDASAAIVISGDTAAELDQRIELTPAGYHSLRGRGETVEVFLVGKVDASASYGRQHQVDAA